MLTQPFKVEKQVWKGSDLTVSQNQAQEHSDNYLGPKKIKVIMSDSLWKIIIHAKKKKWGSPNQNDMKINALKQAQKSYLFTNKDIKPLSGKTEHVIQ